ncbi:hypothetical protein K488DRAFT_54527 [Vararia minispora EC-137]|uniref:Uncharacterized protein n=1 Tax=Vararia minispora EC-137 TaxID=1314806 RepID=A0ACB8QEQ6_9AGAM|nr:hypothetical protein K488DRAFT_54527 [Vararia minispora EC-137]
MCQKPTKFSGHVVRSGQIGLYEHAGQPRVVVEPGLYPRSPFRNWWARSWKGTKNLSDGIITFAGLTCFRLSINQGSIFVVRGSAPNRTSGSYKNSGFVAYSAEGGHKVRIVDQGKLSNPVRDPITKTVLGSTEEVKMTQLFSNTEQEFTTALFFNVLANSCAVLQRGEDFEVCGAGQHCLIDTSVVLRGMYALGENQTEINAKDLYVLFFTHTYLLWCC